jgi:hypothetical protein
MKITARRQAIRRGWRDGYLEALETIRDAFNESARTDGTQPDLSSGWSDWGQWSVTTADIRARGRWEAVYRAACERGATAAWRAARDAAERNADGDVFFIMRDSTPVYVAAYERPTQHGP